MPLRVTKLTGVAVGAGYFSQFHLDAWSRTDQVAISAICDTNQSAAVHACNSYGIPRNYSNFELMLDAEQPDFVDIITGPDSHLQLVQQAAERGIPVICQKALAPTFEEAQQVVQLASAANIPLMIHENFRFQPWYRKIRQLLDEHAIGDRLHNISFRCRTGDGWGPTAYLDRQPYFREMPRLLVFETGVHFVDTFRFLAGEITAVYAQLQRLNQNIVGEDAAQVLFNFDSGATGIWDGNRYNEPACDDPRLTFGEALIEGSGGTIRLYHDGRLTMQMLGEPENVVDYPWNRRGFAGDCVHATQCHFIEQLNNGRNFETSGAEYLKTLAVVEAIYQSAQSCLPVREF